MRPPLRWPRLRLIAVAGFAAAGFLSRRDFAPHAGNLPVGFQNAARVTLKCTGSLQAPNNSLGWLKFSRSHLTGVLLSVGRREPTTLWLISSQRRLAVSPELRCTTRYQTDPSPMHFGHRTPDRVFLTPRAEMLSFLPTGCEKLSALAG